MLETFDMKVRFHNGPCVKSKPQPQQKERSKVASAQSEQQHQTELIKRAEENAHSDYPQCSESQRRKRRRWMVSTRSRGGVP
ncbi:unnamed protein product [Gadus morhua 'NCC']